MLAHPIAPDLRHDLAALAPDLFGRALRLARSPAAAEDLVQDTIERAMRFAPSYRQGTNLKAWTYQILFSVFISGVRKHRRETRAVAALGADPCTWTARDAEPAMKGLSLSAARALASLPPAFRDAIVLVDLEELSYRDAAARLGVPVGTIMSRLHRGRRLLAAALRPPAEAPAAPIFAQRAAR